MINFEVFLDYDKYSTYYRLGYASQLAKHYGCSFLDNGKHRNVFLTKSKKYVIKVPIFADGLEANKREASIYKTYFNSPDKNGIVYSPCKLIKNCLLIMERIVEDYGFIEDIKYTHSLPSWIDMVDCNQVGCLKTGRLVAYDYGDETIYY